MYIQNPRTRTHHHLFTLKRPNELWQKLLCLRKCMLLLLGQEKHFKKEKWRLSLERPIPTALKAHCYQIGSRLGRSRPCPLPPELYPALLPISDSFFAWWQKHVRCLMWDPGGGVSVCSLLPLLSQGKRPRL